MRNYLKDEKRAYPRDNFKSIIELYEKPESKPLLLQAEKIYYIYPKSYIKAFKVEKKKCYFVKPIQNNVHSAFKIFFSVQSHILI